MKKKVLIISYSFPPSSAPAAQRPYFFAKYLAENHDMDVHVLIPSHSDSSLGKSDEKNFEKEKFTLHQSQNLDISSIRKLKDEATVRKKTDKSKYNVLTVFKRYLVNFFRQISYPDKGCTWIPSAVNAAEKILIEKKIDIVFSTSPLWTNHIIALQVNRKTSAKWIADIRDYHYIENIEFRNRSIRKRLDKYLEKKILKKSERVLFVSQSMLEEYSKRYTSIKHGEAIYNGFDPTEFYGNNFMQTLESRKISIFYAGSFYAGIRSPEPLLRALDYLILNKKLDPAELEINIAGNFEKSLLESIENLVSFKSINFLGLIPRKEVLNRAANTHLLWLIVGEKKSHYTGFPVKGYEYIGVRRPILVFTPEHSEPHMIIENLNCGKRLSNDTDEESVIQNAEVIYEYIKEFKKGNLLSPLEIPEEQLKKYTRQYQAEQLAEIINNN